MNFGNRQKLVHGSRAAVITALVIALVILLNAGVTALFSGQLWFLDLTSEGMYTLTEPTKKMLRETFEEVNAKREGANEEDVKVEILFCADPDMLTGNSSMRYIYYTALELAKAFPDTIAVDTVNVWENPSAVNDYRNNSYSSIYQSHIIISSGSEFRVTDIKTYYTYDDDTTDEPWAYNGEKKFVQSIIAVTRAEAPICGITTNHGESFATEEGRAEYSDLLKVISAAGYSIQYLDLANETIPEDCRLILTFDPQTDFVGSFNNPNGTSEIKKMREYLEAANSFMVFADADTPMLPNLEEFLEEWGISLDRYADPADPDTVLGNYLIQSEASVDQPGYEVIGSYETEAWGGSITENMREQGGSPKVVFGNAISISYSKSYEHTYVMEDAEAGNGSFVYGSYYKNNHSRSMFDIFRSGELSVAQVRQNGQLLSDAEGKPLKADTKGDYKLMTITRESRTVGEGQGYTNVNESSYVCAVGSTAFASNKFLLDNSFGNTDLLLATLRSIGREVVPVGLKFKPLYEAEMTAPTTDANGNTVAYYSQSGNVAWTVVLTLLPALVFAGVGTVVLVRRKFRT